MPKAKTAQSRAETTEQHAPSGAGNKENTPLQFDVRIQSIRPGDSIKGTASVNINGAFAIRVSRSLREAMDCLFPCQAIRLGMSTRTSVFLSRRNAENSSMKQSSELMSRQFRRGRIR